MAGQLKSIYTPNVGQSVESELRKMIMIVGGQIDPGFILHANINGYPIDINKDSMISDIINDYRNYLRDKDDSIYKNIVFNSGSIGIMPNIEQTIYKDQLHNPIILGQAAISEMNKTIEEDNLLPVNLEKRINSLSKQIDTLNKDIGELNRIEDKKNRKARKALKQLNKLSQFCWKSQGSVIGHLSEKHHQLESRVDKLDGNVSPVVELGEKEYKDNISMDKIDGVPTVDLTKAGEGYDQYAQITLADYDKLKSLNNTYEEDILNAANRNKELGKTIDNLLDQLHEAKSEISQLQESNLNLSNQVSYHG